jgi:hypothetical protein
LAQQQERLDVLLAEILAKLFANSFLQGSGERKLIQSGRVIGKKSQV